MSTKLNPETVSENVPFVYIKYSELIDLSYKEMIQFALYCLEDASHISNEKTSKYIQECIILIGSWLKDPNSVSWEQLDNASTSCFQFLSCTENFSSSSLLEHSFDSVVKSARYAVLATIVFYHHHDTENNISWCRSFVSDSVNYAASALGYNALGNVEPKFSNVAKTDEYLKAISKYRDYLKNFCTL
jgi:hypothetical protein